MPKGEAAAVDARTAILDAAERAFAEVGFGGVSVRAVARAARVNQALIHHFFETKEGLFTAVIDRRADEINRSRAAALDALEARGDPPLEALVDSLVRPTIELGHDETRGGAEFRRIVVRLANGSDERAPRPTSRLYEDVARRYTAALGRALPGLTPAAAVSGYLYAVGVSLQAMARTNRSALLPDGLVTAVEPDAIVEEVVAFVCAGLRKIAVREAQPDASTTGNRED